MKGEMQKNINMSFTDNSPSQGFSPTDKAKVEIGVFKSPLQKKGRSLGGPISDLKQFQTRVSYIAFTGDQQLVARMDSHNGDLLSIYQGDIHDNLPNGSGLLKFSKDEYYQGSWRRGLAHGEGTLSSNNFIYKGHFSDGLFNGQGNLNIKGKGVYEGSFADGQCNGRGKFTWADGRKIYVGMWKNNLFHGRGLMIWSDGRKYFGDYQFGLKHGKGICVFADGKDIKGMWVRGDLVQSKENK